MTKRQSLSPMKRLAVFEAASGRCHLCGRRIQAGELWEVEHIRAIGLLGEDAESNMAPAHKACHAPKTADDVARISKAKRVKSKHVDRRQSRTPMPGSRQSKWKKKMNGEVVLR
jgi:5-methylcytosine-specific restriction protein A